MSEKTLFYQQKKIKEIMTIYEFNEDKATAIVAWCVNLNGGLIIHWVIKGACKFVQKYPFMSTLEALELFKNLYIEGIGETPVMYQKKVINNLKHTLSIYLDLYIKEIDNKETDIKDKLSANGETLSKLLEISWEKLIKYKIEHESFTCEEAINVFVSNVAYGVSESF